MKIRFIDLFCGCGGLTEGFLQNSNYELVEGVDKDMDSIDTYNLNHKNKGILIEIENYEPTQDDIDLLIGGPPCQGFSTLGRRDNDDPRNGLWKYYFKILEQARPEAFLLENVPPFYGSAQYQKLVKKLKGLGYNFTPSLINSADLGVPQYRKRVFICGRLNGEVPPIPLTHAANSNNGFKSHRSVKFAFRGLPLEPDGKNWHFPPQLSEIIKERLSHISLNGTREDLPMHLRPPCWRKKVNGARDVFGRLSWETPSVTIRTRYVEPMTGRYIHPSEDRPITYREGMRLQTFSSSYKWSGPNPSVARQVGNAVPPKVAKAFSDHFEKEIFS